MKSECVLCGNPEKTRNHLFFSYQFSSQVWETLMSQFLIGDYTTDWDSLVSLLHSSNSNKVKLFLLRYAFESGYTIYGEREIIVGMERSHLLLLVSFGLSIRTCAIASVLSTTKVINFYDERMIMWFVTRV